MERGRVGERKKKKNLGKNEPKEPEKGKTGYIAANGKRGLGGRKTGKITVGDNKKKGSVEKDGDFWEKRAMSLRRGGLEKIN